MAIQSNTYAGTTLAAVDALPATHDVAGFTALTFIVGECALQNVPMIGRSWARVTEELVCAATNSSIKGSAQWDEVSCKFSSKPGDALQDLLIDLEDQRDGLASFRLTLPGRQGTIYFTAQVGKFPLIEGGGQNDIIGKPLELLIQGEPVYVAVV